MSSLFHCQIQTAKSCQTIEKYIYCEHIYTYYLVSPFHDSTMSTKQQFELRFGNSNFDEILSIKLLRKKFKFFKFYLVFYVYS